MSDEASQYVQKALKHLEDQSLQAQRLVEELGNIAGIDNIDSDRDALELRLANNLQSQYTCLCDAFDRLQRPTVSKTMQEGFCCFGTNLPQWEYEAYTECFLSPVQIFLDRYIEILRSNSSDETVGAHQASIRIFENILASTAMLMEQLKTPPKNESEINRFMKKIVSAAFPDTIAPAIPTSVKTYRPEFGVPSLATLAEYKFANSEQELKQCLDGIMTDSRGYQADGKWKRFYAVLFMTGAFFTPAQIEQQFKQCDIHNSWKAIVLVGKGEKRHNSAPQDTPATPAPSAAQPTKPDPTPREQTSTEAAQLDPSPRDQASSPKKGSKS